MAPDSMTSETVESDPSAKADPGIGGAEQNAEKTVAYTQEQLNAIIETRLARERAKLEKERHDAEAECAEQEYRGCRRDLPIIADIRFLADSFCRRDVAFLASFNHFYRVVSIIFYY